MKPSLLAGIVLAFLLLLSCSGDSAETLLETAKLEELQRNFDHAEQLYKEIIQKYPKSPSAQIARERLSAMQQRAPQ